MPDHPQQPDGKRPQFIEFGTFDFAGKGAGTYSGGVVKLRSEPAKDLLDAATSFLKAADRCLNGNKVEPCIDILTIPGAVCAAFSCELYLKYIIYRESSNHPKGHDLDVLFKNCSKESQEALIRRRVDIFEVLQRNSKHFTSARYAHEADLFSFRQQELLQIAETLSSFVREQFPDEAST